MSDDNSLQDPWPDKVWIEHRDLHLAAMTMRVWHSRPPDPDDPPTNEHGPYRSPEYVAKLESEIERLRGMIDEHNERCKTACYNLGATGRCDPHNERLRVCPDCPLDWSIEEEGNGDG